MAPPKALAPMNTGSRPRRPVRASGKASAAKAMRCTSLSLPSGTGGGASIGQSIATVRVSVAASVRGMSRYLRIRWCVSGGARKGKRGLPFDAFAVKEKYAPYQGLGGSDKGKTWAHAMFLKYLDRMFFIWITKEYMLRSKLPGKHDHA